MPETAFPRRLLAIGDIHGCLAALDRLLEQIAPGPDDQLVFLGDYVDRGPDSAGVIDRLLEIRHRLPGTVCLCGNHEQMLLDFLDGRNATLFLLNGGEETISSYQRHGGWPPPETHRRFFDSLHDSYETDDFIFVHAGLRPGTPLADQVRSDLLWIRGEFLESDADWGKPVVFGHTPQRAPLFLPNRVGLDTGCVYGRALTGCDLLTGRTWQA